MRALTQRVAAVGSELRAVRAARGLKAEIEAAVIEAKLEGLQVRLGIVACQIRAEVEAGRLAATLVVDQLGASISAAVLFASLNGLPATLRASPRASEIRVLAQVGRFVAQAYREDVTLASDFGLLLKQSYCESDYFGEDYVGSSFAF